MNKRNVFKKLPIILGVFFIFSWGMWVSAEEVPGSLSGVIFKDVKGNAVQDSGDAGRAEVKVFLVGTVSMSTTTSANGSYSFIELPSGTYQVCEVYDSKWMQTLPNDTYDCGNGYVGYEVVVSGEPITGLDFGNFQGGRIHGKVYDDTNQNGEDNEEEKALENWLVYVDENNSGGFEDEEVSIATGADGRYLFSNLGPGTYTVRELLKKGWVRTDPTAGDTGTGGMEDGSYVVTMTSNGNKSERNFGNYESEVKNTAPYSTDISVTTQVDTSIEVLLGGLTDSDGDTLIYSITTPPVHGTQSAIVGNKVVYTPATSFVGNDSFQFTAFDGAVYGNVATGTVIILEEEVTDTREHGGGGCLNCGTERQPTERARQDTVTNEKKIDLQDAKAPDVVRVRSIETDLQLTDLQAKKVGTPAGMAEIEWNTNLPAQGLVVCSLTPKELDRDAPHFGYEWSTKVVARLTREHRMPLSHLAPGPHYCRVAGRVSNDDAWVLSDELLFYSKGQPVQTEIVSGEKEVVEEVVEEESTPSEEDSTMQVANVFTALGDVVSPRACGTVWWVWIFVGCMLLFVGLSFQLVQTVQAMIGVLSIALLLAFTVGWACSSIPLGVLSIGLLIRYALLKGR